MFVSITTDTNDNAFPPAQSTPYFSVMDQLSIGISNGIGNVGQAGNRYVGIARQVGAVSNYPSGDATHSAPFYEYATGYMYYHTAIGDGASVIYGTQGNNVDALSVASLDPSGLSGYAMGLVIDISLSGSSVTLTSFGSNNVSDVSYANLRSTMLLSTCVGSLPPASGGWWNGAPINMRHIHIRYPAYFARLRIHAVEVMNLT